MGLGKYGKQQEYVHPKILKYDNDDCWNSFIELLDELFSTVDINDIFNRDVNDVAIVVCDICIHAADNKENTHTK